MVSNPNPNFFIEHHPSPHYPFRRGLRERKGSRAGKSKPNRSARAQPPRQGHLPRGEALCPRLPEALLLPSWPAASFQVQSFSPFLVASLATFKFHPWGQGQMSAWVLTKVFVLMHNRILLHHKKRRKSCHLPQHAAAATAESLQLCPTLCDPIDGSPPGSAVPGILQARTLEWAAISFCNA